ncbi:MAG: 30S ribosomal protein S6 [Phycisphaeraceae bacterium]|nr:30S ribosomal protein S6 [Phycisphaeraceae bacterium]MCW5754206.1 30S ribosomal protein S6 [Phycisphaeraceae bacterium]
MPEQRTYTYEVMFLLSQAVAADFGAAIAHINDLLTRANAQVLAMQKWDERRLAYEIQKQRRGVYILAYIKAPNDHMASFERDCNLSEKIMRTLITRADHLTEEEMRSADQRNELEIEARLRAEQKRDAEPTSVTVAVASQDEPTEETSEEDLD